MLRQSPSAMSSSSSARLDFEPGPGATVRPGRAVDPAARSGWHGGACRYAWSGREGAGCGLAVRGGPDHDSSALPGQGWAGPVTVLLRGRSGRRPAARLCRRWQYRLDAARGGAGLVEIDHPHDDRGLLNPGATAPCLTLRRSTAPPLARLALFRVRGSSSCPAPSDRRNRDGMLVSR